ncbi:peptidoglycan DD-metalloendopeptidase family protein [Shewanella sp. JNE10-2]|uniref:peptidoglycan DD-metalloendopeptidase family protein n=1 Tax=unclassified Shewanella TaxID=196818 RepID=UPI0020048352|nr:MULTISPECIES: peptidoglycan DD-metalloendopeptidase family protein [unclassified Shewanella]MCK7628489.1 peptidoglycan DD-metalloendopeptidase family protein [Shewanella sp. JNE9-1]MCK7632403.1 peptidoglycan DD-metalloendopeptidase family protein [Shewanella sp. JNE17]MCK7643738.1 peptidoglycan DD-metalloendopeptidase family protein [Shewanella sp. JNE3-1]MCK7647915.1 peptidoglycan DD-metalloendopeptidase family protein [Shewanella sp. JNE8]MCK7651792.1 peptidoglycan DD-metalloendopeptidase
MGKVITLFKLLPKKHQILLSILSVITMITMLLPSEEAQASRQTAGISEQTQINTRYDVPLAFRSPQRPESIEGESSDVPANAEPLSSTDALAAGNANNQAVESIESALHRDVEHFNVKNGDTLAAVFDRAGLTSKDVYEITQLPLAKQNLLKIMPGEEIVISKDVKGDLTEVRYRINAISTLVISKNQEQYHEKISEKDVEIRTHFTSAKIKSNFWNSAVDAGLNANQIMQLSTVFGWDIDFALDLREGDSFAIIYEQEYAEGEFLRNGNILAAEFINQDERYTAIRYTDGNYYSENGTSMRKAFLRSPVDFKYVSSNFNPKRLHPVTGQIKAHRGVDYVAAIGTPIKAAGSGRVIESGYNQFNGNYVFIKHNDTYTTKYLHLTKRNVSKGANVKQGQIIGTLGKTGRVTGAHLHYEFIVNGVHRNPRTITLPKAESIARKEKPQFDALSRQLMATISQNKQTQLAMQ